MNKFLRRKYSLLFSCMDAAVILMVVLNLSAVFLTNLLIFKTSPDVVFVELNPVMGAVHDWEVPALWATILFSLFKQAFFLFILCAFYLHQRFRVRTLQAARILGFFCLWLLIVYSLDFFNNFGFFVGWLLWS